MKRNKMSKLGLNLKDDVRKDKDYFLKSTSRESTSLFQISNDNPQKDNFHNPIFAIDNKVTFGTVNSTVLTKLSLSEGGGDQFG